MRHPWFQTTETEELLQDQTPSSGTERTDSPTIPVPADPYEQLAVEIREANERLDLELDPIIAEACRLFFENLN